MPSSIGSALGSVGSALGGLFGGGGAGATPSVPTPPSPTTYDPLTATDFPATSIAPADGGGPLSSVLGAAPATAMSLLPTSLAPTDGTTGATSLAPLTTASMPAAGTPSATTDPSNAFLNWLKGDVTGARGALGTPMSALGTLGNVIEAYNRWQTMRTLQDPAALASGAAKLYQPMSKALKRAIISPVTAAAQETGQINAPGLYSQSVATALAPYQYQMQMNALNDYIQALEASGHAYPEGGLYAGGLVPQGIYGGGH